MNEPKSLDQALAEAFSKADHLQAPLDKRLKLYLGESRKLLPEMEATYDQRPAPWLFALYLMPFVLVGGLWLKVLAAKRRPPSDSTARGPSQPR